MSELEDIQHVSVVSLRAEVESPWLEAEARAVLDRRWKARGLAATYTEKVYRDEHYWLSDLESGEKLWCLNIIRHEVRPPS
jgi:hypothetical protein